MRYTWLWVRMKIDPPDTAIDASVIPSSRFIASLRHVFPGAITVVTPSSLWKWIRPSTNPARPSSFHTGASGEAYIGISFPSMTSYIRSTERKSTPGPSMLE